MRRNNVLDWVILKISERCNLTCRYCYVFRRGDETWHNRPPEISEEVVEALGKRIAEHCAIHELHDFYIELHGGEPLLVGIKKMQKIVRRIRSICPNVTIHFFMQTNGLLLNLEWLKYLDSEDITFGISLDGPPEITDKNRVRANGIGIADELIYNIATLRARTPLFNKLNTGCLCVVDPNANGANLTKWFVEQGFKFFDFLLPNGNHSNLPENWSGSTPYAKFLCDAYNIWRSMGESAPRIREFEHIIQGFCGIRSGLDSLGGDLRGMCVVHSDGTYGANDVIRICGGIFTENSLNIFNSSFDQIAPHYNIEQIQKVPTKCSQCEFLCSCGGGYIAHRYNGKDFTSPSIYCNALYQLCTTAKAHLREVVPDHLWIKKTGR